MVPMFIVFMCENDMTGQDMTENVFEVTEMAKTVREIRARVPNFDMVRFLRNLKQDIQPVIQVSPAPALKHLRVSGAVGVQINPSKWFIWPN